MHLPPESPDAQSPHLRIMSSEAGVPIRFQRCLSSFRLCKSDPSFGQLGTNFLDNALVRFAVFFGNCDDMLPAVVHPGLRIGADWFLWICVPHFDAIYLLN